MDSTAYLLAQDRLSMLGSFILCDATSEGFPIRHASQGFSDLSEFPIAECLGEKCGDLVGAPAIMARDPGLTLLADAMGLRTMDAEAALAFLRARCAEQCRMMMQCSEWVNGCSVVYCCLAVNQKKGGSLFVCELAILALRHPAFNSPYCLGLQRDVSEEVSVQQLLAAAAADSKDTVANRGTGGRYAAIMEAREQGSNGANGARLVLQQRMDFCCTNGGGLLQYLHEKAAAEMWQTWLEQQRAVPAFLGNHVSEGPLAEGCQVEARTDDRRSTAEAGPTLGMKTLNVDFTEYKDSRGRLTVSMHEVRQSMLVSVVSFDEARLLLVKSRMAEMGVDESGMPMDPKLFTFDLKRQVTHEAPPRWQECLRFVRRTPARRTAVEGLGYVNTTDSSCSSPPLSWTFHSYDS
jgi:hypothetical protein